MGIGFVTILRQDKQLINHSMFRKPKYKRGFTWTHYYDEWWDRRGQEFKIRFYVGLGSLILGAVGIGLCGWFRQLEKNELLAAAQKHPEAKHSTEGDLLLKKSTPRSGPQAWNRP